MAAGWAWFVGAWLLVACDGLPTIELDDGGIADARDAHDTGAIARTPEYSFGTLTTEGGAGTASFGPMPVSPSACAGPGDPAFCPDCYAWTDEGPDSLGRNVGGEGFGAVSTGDFNGDGYPDLAIGAPYDDEHEEDGLGAVFLYLGSESGFLPWRALRLDWDIEGLGFRTAVGDFDGDGDVDVAAVYTSDDGGVVVFANDGAGGFAATTWITVSGLLDPDDDPLVTSEFGWAFQSRDLDGDAADDLVVGVPDWNSGSGAVLVGFGGGSSIWIDARDIGHSPTPDDRFGAALLVEPELDAELYVGAPGLEIVASFNVSGSREASGGVDMVSSFSPGGGFGASITSRDGVLAVGGSGLKIVELFFFGDPRYVHFEDYATTALALLDSNGDGRLEMLGLWDEGPSSVGGLRLFFGIDEDPMVMPIFTTPDAMPTRVAGDDLGRQAVVGDWNVDGLDDVALGAQALLSTTHAGMVFGYLGMEEPFSSADNDLDFEDAYFLIDQETPACDRCVALHLDDGEWCQIGLCVEYECITPTGCGDGWPMPGETPARESCDDRNLDDGDGCSSTCTPTPFVIASREGASDTPGSNRVLALDGNGAALVVWTADLETSTEVRARRYTRYAVEADGAEDATPLVLASMPGPGWAPHAVVAGLAGGGWTVAWAQPTGSDGAAITARRVAVDGTLGRAVRVSDATEVYGREPTIISQEGATIVLWTDASDPRSPRVRYRAIRPDGTFEGAPVEISAEPGSSPAAVAGPGFGVLVAWIETAQTLGERSRVVGTRFGPSGPIDATPFEISEEGASISVAAAGGEFAVAWVGYSLDPAGDIFVRRIPGSGDPDVYAATRVTERAGTSPHAELRPSVAFRGNGWIVGWDEPTEGRAALAGEVSLPPEYEEYLEDELAEGSQRALTLVGSSRGTWVLWSDARRDLDPAPARSLRGFVLHAN